MSVPLSKRGESELRVLTKSDELAAYTIHICSNEKHFPKRYRWCITAKIVDSSIDIVRYIKMANSLFINKDEEKFKLRLIYQDEAIASTYSLLAMIDIAYRTFSIESRRIEYWTGLIIEVQTLLRNWQKVNKQQFEKYKLG